MRNLLAVSAVAGLLSLGAAGTARAMPMPGAAVTAGTPDITLVAQGCGPGSFRDRGGRCIGRRPPPPPRFCPPGLHRTPYGCRRF